MKLLWVIALMFWLVMLETQGDGKTLIQTKLPSSPLSLSCVDTVGKVQCGSTAEECVSHELLCDQWSDCSNGWDESKEICQDCPGFQCPNSTLCLPAFWICDDQEDCPGGEDEAGCICGGFICGDGKCIPKEWVCDHEKDCADGSDEGEDCSTPGPACGEDQFECKNGKCIPNYYRCDGWPDCDESEDEEGCPCDRFECANGECIPTPWECDGEWDCSDGSDEKHCDCKEDEFYCEVCVPKKYICDHVVDCPDGSDEANCNYTMARLPEKKLKVLKLSHEQEVSGRHSRPSKKAKEAIKIARRDSRRKLNQNTIKNLKETKSQIRIPKKPIARQSRQFFANF